MASVSSSVLLQPLTELETHQLAEMPPSLPPVPGSQVCTGFSPGCRIRTQALMFMHEHLTRGTSSPVLSIKLFFKHDVALYTNSCTLFVPDTEYVQPVHTVLQREK